VNGQLHNLGVEPSLGRDGLTDAGTVFQGTGGASSTAMPAGKSVKPSAQLLANRSCRCWPRPLSHRLDAPATACTVGNHDGEPAHLHGHLQHWQASANNRQAFLLRRQRAADIDCALGGESPSPAPEPHPRCALRRISRTARLRNPRFREADRKHPSTCPSQAKTDSHDLRR